MISLLDELLDRTVLPGYTRIGYELRRRAWRPLAPGALRGSTALVTGANSGLGKATAAGYASLGARVHLLVRDKGRGEQAIRQISDRVPDARLDLEVCDVSDLADVAAFASRFTERRDASLDILVHNAGVFPQERRLSPQGHELALATHVLGPHLLTHLLRPVMRAAEPGRVIWVTSGGMYSQRLPDDDLEYEQGTYRAATAYARTKRMQVVLAEEWAAALSAEHIVVHSTHPGWVDTPGVRSSLPRFRTLTRPIIRAPAQGADTIVWLGAAPEAAASTGMLWHDRRPRPTHYLPFTHDTDAARRHLWETCERATAAHR